MNTKTPLAEKDSYVTVRTEKGERKRFVLGDGSEVYLNADSKISYPTSPGGKQAVYVEGEAFIKIAKNRDSMVVKSAGIETTVKGKAFNISAFPKDSTIKVSVDQGNAEIRGAAKAWPLMKLRIPAQQPVLAKNRDSAFHDLRPAAIALVKLKPSVVIGQDAYAVINKQEHHVDLLPAANDNKAFGWKDGIIYFDNASLAEITEKLERWYGVEITVCDAALGVNRYTAEFRNMNLQEVLKKISSSLNIGFQVKGKNIYFCNEPTNNPAVLNPSASPPD
nr:FecR domain-containing protein [Pedobacter sp. SYSU D00382]